MRPRLVIAVGLVLLLVVAGLLVWSLAFRDSATLVTPAEVVQDVAGGSEVSDESSDPGFVVGAEPGDPGLYTYATTGFEEVDALGGARHDYPAETYGTLQPGGCGTRMRWTALEERWEEVESCDTAGGLSVVSYDSFHEWFGQTDLQEFACGPIEAVAIPSGDGGPWAYECTNDGRVEAFDVELIGTEMLQVDGQDVETIHVRITSTLSGESTGTSETDTWYLSGAGLIVQSVVDRRNINQSPIGAVSYTEKYEIRLTSLEPQDVPVS